MGDPRRRRKQYASPGHPYEQARIESELILVGRYGLRNKKELWKARTYLGNYRAQARTVLALEGDEKEVAEITLVSKLIRLGVVPEGVSSDEILGLEVESVLRRRLQTMVLEKGLASTVHQARQLIAHRHIAIQGRIMTAPSYIVPLKDEESITYAVTSPFFENPEHPTVKSSLSKESTLVEIPKKQIRGRRR